MENLTVIYFQLWNFYNYCSLERVYNFIVYNHWHHFVILQLYNYFEDSNYVYLILEMCHNSEINRYLKKTGRPVGENEGKDRLMFSLTCSIEELIDNSWWNLE